MLATDALTSTFMRLREVPTTAKPLASAKLNHGIIVFLGGTKSRGEFFDGEEVPVGGAGRIVEFLEKVFELGLMTQWKNEDKAHDLRGGEAPEGLRLPIEGCFAHMTRSQRLRLRLTNESRDQYHRDEHE